MLARICDVQSDGTSIMNNPLYSLFAFSQFFLAVFFGGVLIFVAVGRVSSISTVAEFLFMCGTINVGMLVIWLGWWFKRAVTGRKGLVFGWNWDLFFIKELPPEAKINKFRYQAIYLIGSLLGIFVLIYLNSLF